MLLLHRRQTPPRSQGSFLIQGEKAPSHNWDRFHNSGSVPPRGLHFLEAAVSSSLVGSRLLHSWGTSVAPLEEGTANRLWGLLLLHPAPFARGLRLTRSLASCSISRKVALGWASRHSFIPLKISSLKVRHSLSMASSIWSSTIRCS